jgi:hypothetical protein
MTRKKLSSEQYEALEKRLQEQVLIPADYPLLLRILKQILPAKENPENKDPDNGKPKPAKGKTAWPSQNGKRREKNKGHGRNSEKDYLGARDVKVPRGGCS